MAIGLTVVSAFDSYQKGDRITDEKTVADISASENARHVVRHVLPDETSPATAKAKTAAKTAA